MPLNFLALNETNVSDLSPLRGMALKKLSCDFKAERDTEIVRSITTLETINWRRSADFWRLVEALPPGETLRRPAPP